jgi:HEAT repeat protein
LAVITDLVKRGGSEAGRMLASALTLPDPEFQEQLADRLKALGAPAVVALATAVNDPNPDVQLAARALLERFRDNATTEQFSAELHSPVSAVRAAAALALGKLAEKSAAAALIQQSLSDPDPASREAAGAALRDIGQALIAPVQELLGSTSPTAHARAVDALAAEGRAVVLALVDRLDDSHPLVRATVAEVLGKVADPRAAEALGPLVGDPDPDVRLAAIQALGHLKTEAAVRGLVAHLTDADDEVKAEVGKALVAQGAIALPVLTQLLGTHQRDLKTAALDILGRIRDRRARPAVARCLSATEPWLRSAAAHALGRLGDPESLDSLIAGLSDPVPLVRAAVAEALGELRVLRATEALVPVLNDAELVVQLSVVRALAKVGSETAADPLLTLLTDGRFPGAPVGQPTPDVRLWVAAIAALSDLRDARAIPRFQKLTRPWPLSTAPAEVKAAARLALKQYQPAF